MPIQLRFTRLLTREDRRQGCSAVGCPLTMVFGRGSGSRVERIGGGDLAG